MRVENETITFDFIWECWKNNIYPENFDNLLNNYLEIKLRMFGNTANFPAKDKSGENDAMFSWLSKILISIDIGISRNPAAFEKWKIRWEMILNRKWEASIEDKWVVWK